MKHALRAVTRSALAMALALTASGCANLGPTSGNAVPTVSRVDLERFAGPWYLIAHIPTDRDRAAHNAVEIYAPQADGSVAMTYSNRLGGFDGTPKHMTPVGFPSPDTGNAVWGIRFTIPGTPLVWPFRYEYRISYLAPDYSEMIVARSRQDLLWLFSRQPTMDAARYAAHRARIAAWGYAAEDLQRVPQCWPPGVKPGPQPPPALTDCGQASGGAPP